MQNLSITKLIVNIYIGYATKHIVAMKYFVVNVVYPDLIFHNISLSSI